MQLQFTKPELEKFITEQVDAGNFPSPQAAIEAAVEQMMHDHAGVVLTEDDIQAINESDAQIGHGEYVEFHAFAAEIRKKYSSR